ncbi:m7GpppN-mRNA hydrolase, partial [Parasteatoda tepidariorum]
TVCLYSRFIINVPEEERVDLIRLCFQIELAHWFYLDFYCEENPKLPKCTVKEFINIIFRHIPFLQKYCQDIDAVIADWREYKSAVPTYGAILLDQNLDNVLLVQSYYSKASWGFPKGKVNEDEKPYHCAIREVFEETGFDITDYIKNEEFLEHYFNEQLIRLYIITGIPLDAKFHPRTRKEIKACEWFPVNHLPTGKRDEASKTKLGPNNFFMVIPFVKQLQKWIASYKEKESLSDVEKDSKMDKQFIKQQRLFSQLTKKDLATYIKGDAFSDKGNRSDSSNYSPPPRMLRQKNLKHSEKKKVSGSNHPMGKNAVSKNELKFEGFKESKEGQENIFRPSITWKNFYLDSEAIVATFNISMRYIHINILFIPKNLLSG